MKVKVRIVFSVAVSVMVAISIARSAVSYGPQPLPCPADAVRLAPGADLPFLVSANLPGTTFCVEAGLHAPVTPIYMKAGQSLVGEFGAVIDGTNVRQGWDQPSTSIISGWNCAQDCSGVTVRNLTIRNLTAHNCVGVYGANAGGWTIDHNEITGCSYGVNAGYQRGMRVTWNSIHHNRGNPEFSGGYGGNYLVDAVFASNRFEANNRTQKVTGTTGVVFRDNVFVGEANAIWYDGDNVDALIEGNTITDCSEVGIFYEISGPGVIRNNTVLRCGSHGIFLSTSRDVQVSGNVVEGNWRGIGMLVSCAAVSPAGVPDAGAIGWDLRNNTASQNRITVGPQPDAIASYIGQYGCTPAAFAPYLSGEKRLAFVGNVYAAPPTLRAWSFGDALNQIVR